MRESRRKAKRLTILSIILLLVIGYAALTANLKIDGTINVTRTNWDVHFENVQITQGSVTANPAPTSDNTTTTEMTYTINFTKPGDFFEFTTDIANDGTMNAMVELIANNTYNGTGTTQIDLPSYLLNEVTYNDGSEIEQYHLLAHGTKEKIKVRVEFKKDIQTSDLPSGGDTTVVFKFGGSFKQADANAIDRADVANHCQATMTKILADPNKYRNREQSRENLDIGLDDQCRVMNLDLWVDNETELSSDIGKEYFINMDSTDDGYVYYIELGYGENTYLQTPATTIGIVDGELTVPFPAYILMNGRSEFLPVKTLGKFIFTNIARKSNPKFLSKMPHIPNTVTTIYGTFQGQNIEVVTIPKQIEVLDGAFVGNYIHTLKFEEGSRLKRIDSFAFDSNNLTGDLTLPPSVEYIGKRAFRHNNLTSVTFSSTTTYLYDERDPDDNSFEPSVIINHNYP